ncbi:MAG: tRNA (N(6)-L-threonylcarbamoyladenosine(37)-C(2))-methylthiotransferase MtaB [Bacteroides sp.]|nr:tRNA (N(6)-L-threonylcarbamoyladenosine(37)-C(2))-methylthiotransferase MtaB [Bacteroides sp.]MCM1379323.1 tRNA (N(6)-L-threonylcarbamoyladenosine(37)-C(2))-methylthiotransferase MtaB [Bacteroides sp.]MCM1445018.1 tRNA (N(6)-L-threonylcarbamoyladenosine(37)-C(2))-methylthiotransferase MtaB [Prevotella sp.]
MKAQYETLGCKLNFAETGTIAAALADRGVARVAPGEVPDVCVVNTCSVTQEADRKCRRLIRSLHTRYPRARIIVTGCYAQLQPVEVAALPGVEMVVGINDKLRIADYVTSQAEPEAVEPSKLLREFMPSCSRGDRTRYFLKVQDGCNYWCSYCTIPAARGRSRSGAIDDLVKQAAGVAAEGGKEIVITGVNIGDYGNGTDRNFLDLIRALDRVDGIERYRISSLEPDLLTDEIIEFVAQSRRFMPHFHIPLQCGADEVLRLMRRHYRSQLFADKVTAIREAMPDAFIGVDLIVGARGETPELFAQSRAFVESLPISRLHVFPYSERPGTRALTDIDFVVSQEEKHRRMQVMTEVSTAKQRAFSEPFVGMVRPVLIEHVSHGKTGGFTDNYLRVELPEKRPDLANKVVNARLVELVAEADKFIAEIDETD